MANNEGVMGEEVLTKTLNGYNPIDKLCFMIYTALIKRADRNKRRLRRNACAFAEASFLFRGEENTKE